MADKTNKEKHYESLLKGMLQEERFFIYLIFIHLIIMSRYLKSVDFVPAELEIKTCDLPHKYHDSALFERKK